MTRETGVRERMRELAHRWPRFGYRRLGVLLRREGMAVNHKRIYRLYTEEDLKVRRKRKKIRSRLRVPPLPVPSRPNERWSMDFMQDCMANGRRFRILTIVDDFTRECPAIEVDTSLPGARVVRALDRLAFLRGLPRMLVMDNGSEFTGRVLDTWANRNGVKMHFIDPGRPMQNAYVESFNGKFRDECLDLN
jgi:putative transposase